MISRRALLVFGAGAGFTALSARALRAASTNRDDWAELRAQAQTGRIQLEPNRVYRIGRSLELASNVIVVGDRTSVISPEGNFPAVLVRGGKVRLRGFSIRGRRDVYGANYNHGIFIDWRRQRGGDLEISDMLIEEVAGSGIIALASQATRSSGMSVTDSQVRYTGAHGIIAQDYIDDVIFERNEVVASGLMVPDRPGLTASRHGRRVIIRNNVCRGHPASLGSSTHGISMDMCSEAECTSNVVSGWGQGYGIEAGGVAGGTIASNRIAECRYGICLSGRQSLFINRDLIVEDNEITDSEEAGLYAFVGQSDGLTRHRGIVFRSNRIESVTGRNIGVGAFFSDIDGLIVEDLEVTGSRRSGVFILDCPNHVLSRIWSYENNSELSPQHAGLTILWRKVSPDKRGSNRLSANRIELNGGGRNLGLER